jgi:hypothetical protein
MIALGKILHHNLDALCLASSTLTTDKDGLTLSSAAPAQHHMLR